MSSVDLGADLPVDGGAPWIAFASARSGTFALYLVHADGSDLHAVAEGGTSLAPAWSPDGKSLAFVSNRGGNGFALYVLDVDTSAVRAIDTGTSLVALPAWSPDGERIAFGAGDGIFVVAQAGGTATRLTSGMRDSGPAWAPDGNTIYFSSIASGAFEIWAVAPDGTNPRQITTGANVLGAPVVVPDGTALAFTQTVASSGLGPSSGVALFSLTTMQTMIVSSLGDAEPAFAPTGDRLAVSSTRYASNNVELVLLDWPSASNPVRLTDSAGTDGHAAFQPRR